MYKLLVYGSLRKGLGNHQVIFGAKHVGNTTVKGTLYSLGAYPCLTLKDGKTDVAVECYEIDEVCLKRCDRLEGHPNFYRREEIETDFGPAFIYTMDHNPGPYCNTNKIVESGDWYKEYKGYATAAN